MRDARRQAKKYGASRHVLAYNAGPRLSSEDRRRGDEQLLRAVVKFKAALKFLPQQKASDPKRLELLRRQVRLSRQIAHPSVCRVCDIAEVDGLVFLSMEYVDGEDLGALLRLAAQADTRGRILGRGVGELADAPGEADCCTFACSAAGV